jgi:hypothetical protein
LIDYKTISHERAEALFVAPDGFFSSRRVQFAILAARNGIPAAYTIANMPKPADYTQCYSAGAEDGGLSWQLLSTA